MTRNRKNARKLDKKKIFIFLLFIIILIFIFSKLSKSSKQPADMQKQSSTTNIVEQKKDSVPPTLTLQGNSEINIAINSKYQDLGCTATDNIDGDLTTKINIDNNIDTTKKGNYTVNYTVQDSSGNKSTISRSVHVVDKGSKNISTEKSSGLPVLMYHFFYDKNNIPSKIDGNYMEIHDFEEQLKYLTENNYYFPTWEEVENYVKGKSCLPVHSIVITVDDLKTSQKFIGNATVFCYPFGHYNQRCEEILNEAGYNLAFTTAYGRIRPGDNPYKLSRIRMSKGDSLKSFISKIS